MGIGVARDEQWTLTRTGNWSRNKLDLNGDGDFTDAGEHDDTQAFNDANELLTRDTDSNSVVDLTLAHDAVGNLTDDGNANNNDYDSIGRMVRILADTPHPAPRRRTPHPDGPAPHLRTPPRPADTAAGYTGGRYTLHPFIRMNG